MSSSASAHSAFTTPASSAPSTPSAGRSTQPLDFQRAPACAQGNFYLSTSPEALASDLGMWFADLRQEARATTPRRQPQASNAQGSSFGGLLSKFFLS